MPISGSTPMSARVVWTVFAALLLVVATTFSSRASDYPNRPIRVIVGVSAGGIGDIFMRALGERLTAALKQPLIIENRPGGAFNIAARNCAESPPDGYTICLLPGEPLTYNQHLFKNPGFDPVADLTPITNLFFITQVVAVNASLGVKTFDQLAALSREKPGTLSFTAPSLAHAMYIEAFKKRTGADIVLVPFKGGGDAMANFLSGSVPVVFLGLGNVLPYIESGKANVLMSDGATRSRLIPDVPTVGENSDKTIELTRSYFGLVAPAKTPPAVIETLNKAVADVYGDREFVDKQLISRGLDPAVTTPADFAKFLAQDREIAARIVKASGRQPQ